MITGLLQALQWLGEVLKGLFQITIKKIKINMFNKTTINYNFFGQMSVEEMVRTVKGLGEHDQITIKYPEEPEQRSAVESQNKSTEPQNTNDPD